MSLIEEYEKAAGILLRAERKNKKLSAQKVADMLSVDRSTVSYWETGERTISLGQFLLYCKVIEADPVEITLKVLEAIAPEDEQVKKYELENKPMKKYVEVIGSLLREERKKKGFTAEQIANVLDCSRSIVSYWETGKRDISTEQFFQYCDALGIEASDLAHKIQHGD